MPLTTISFTIATLSLAGLPPLNGFVSKYLLYTALIDKGLAPLTLVIVLSSAFALLAHSKIIYGVWLKTPIRGLEGVHDPTWRMSIPLLILAILCVVLGLASPYIIEKLITSAVINLAYNTSDYVKEAFNVLASVLAGR